MSNVNWQWELTARAVGDIVEEHGGAVVMTRAELVEAIQEEDSRLVGCSQTIAEHITCCLRRVGLTSRSFGYGGKDPNILLIWDEQKMTGEEARDKVKRDGVSDAVRIELFERQPVGAGA